MLREKLEKTISLLSKVEPTACFFDSYTFIMNVSVDHSVIFTEEDADALR
jgi:hypothetical protein